MEGPRKSLARRFRVPLAALAALLLMALGAGAVLAGCGNLDAATLTGTWQFRITVSGYSGGPVSSDEIAVGTTSVTSVNLSTSCADTGQCTAEMQPPSSSLGSEV